MIDPNRSQSSHNPQSYQSAISQPKIERPATVSGLAFLGIVVGSLLLFCDMVVTVVDANMLKHSGISPVPGVPPLDPFLVKFQAANAIAGAVFGAILLCGCLAALWLRRWARTLMLVWSFAFILCGIARTIGEIKYVGPANLAWVERNQPEDPNFASGRMAATLVPKAIGALALYCVLPILFLSLWTRSEVKEAFEHDMKMRERDGG